MSASMIRAEASGNPGGSPTLPPGDLEIRSGGLVAVDTASLEVAATELDQVHTDIVDVAEMLRRAAVELTGVVHLVGEAVVFRAWVLADIAARRAHTPSALAGGLRASAALFDVVELQAQRCRSVWHPARSS